ncbi:MAG: S-layer homology domain-containing protein [Nitrospinota bacterium]
MRREVRAWVSAILWTGMLLCLATPSAAQEVQDLYFKAWVALRAGQSATAETILEAMRRRHPEDPRPYMGLGDLSFLRKDYARSLRLYGEALALSPADVRILAGLGKWAFFAGDRERARRRLREALDRRPGDLEARAYLTYLGEQANWPRQVAVAAAAQGITRGQMAGLMAAHLADVKGVKESPFTEILTDVSSHWARNAILNVVRKAWIPPRPDHTFGPQEPLTRGELAEVVYNISLSAGVRVREALGAIRPEDIAPEHRSLQAILFAVGRGLMSAREGGKFSPLEGVSGLEAIETLERVKRLFFPTGLERG